MEKKTIFFSNSFSFWLSQKKTSLPWIILSWVFFSTIPYLLFDFCFSISYSSLLLIPSSLQLVFFLVYPTFLALILVGFFFHYPLSIVWFLFLNFLFKSFAYPIFFATCFLFGLSHVPCSNFGWVFFSTIPYLLFDFCFSISYSIFCLSHLLCIVFFLVYPTFLALILVGFFFSTIPYLLFDFCFSISYSSLLLIPSSLQLVFFLVYPTFLALILVGFFFHYPLSIVWFLFLNFLFKSFAYPIFFATRFVFGLSHLPRPNFVWGIFFHYPKRVAKKMGSIVWFLFLNFNYSNLLLIPSSLQLVFFLVYPTFLALKENELQRRWDKQKTWIRNWETKIKQ